MMARQLEGALERRCPRAPTCQGRRADPAGADRGDRAAELQRRRGAPRRPRRGVGGRLERQGRHRDRRPSASVADVDITIVPGLPAPTEPAEPTRAARWPTTCRSASPTRCTWTASGRRCAWLTSARAAASSSSRTAQAAEDHLDDPRMLLRLCETGRMRAFESAYLIERATARARSWPAGGDGAARPLPASASRLLRRRASRRAMPWRRSGWTRRPAAAGDVEGGAVVGLVRTNGRPSVTFTPCSTPRYLTGISPWSWSSPPPGRTRPGGRARCGRA